MALGGEQTLWLLDAGWAFFWVIFVSIWAHMGFYTLILLAGLQAIPKDVYEAAEMDGATPARVFWRITLPLLMPNMVVVLVLALIKGVQTFDEIYVLTGGGPGSATTLMVQFIYDTGLRLPAAALRHRGRGLDPARRGAARADAACSSAPTGAASRG